MSEEWSVKDVRDDGWVEMQGYRCVYVIPKETAARLGHELLRATGEPTIGEIERLRGIEAAALNGQTRADAAIRFRAMAREFLLYKDRAPLLAIADALEATHER